MEQNLKTKNCFETIEILKKHGFIEETKLVNPDHYRRLKELGEYNPSNVKRYFKNGNIHIIFDYDSFQFWYLSPCIIYSVRENIPVEQLASILFFSMIQPKQRIALRKKLNDNYKIAHIYEYLKDFKGLNDFKFGKEVNYMADLFDIIEHMRKDLTSNKLD